jgi:hypothetical protein
MRPTPYSKRWFTPDLKTQQVEANQLPSMDKSDELPLRRSWTSLPARTLSSLWFLAYSKAANSILERFTPDMRPTPYSKRWFTPDLKTQQVEANQLRRWPGLNVLLWINPTSYLFADPGPVCPLVRFPRFGSWLIPDLSIEGH